MIAAIKKRRAALVNTVEQDSKTGDSIGPPSTDLAADSNTIRYITSLAPRTPHTRLGNWQSLASPEIFAENMSLCFFHSWSVGAFPKSFIRIKK
jgi:hypothetical protein